MKKRSLVLLLVVLSVATVVLAGCGGGKEKPPEEILFPVGDPFVTNVAGSDGKLIKMTMQVCSDSKDITKLLTGKEPIARDLLLSILRTQTEEQLSSPNLQASLSDVMSARLNDYFDTDIITKIVFTDIVMQ